MNDPKPKRPVHTGTVISIDRLTPHMVRVELGGEGLAQFTPGEFTDQYVKIQFPADDSGSGRPRVRSYSVRRWDPVSRSLTLDVIYHGDTGLSGPWLSGLKLGDRVSFLGPGGGYAPNPAAPWHLLIGDESVIPAIAASLERMPAEAHAIVLIEVDGPEDQLPLEGPERLDLRWLHRDPDATAEESPLIEAISELSFPAGDPQVFLHGEATAVRELIRHLVVDRGLDRQEMSASGYWKRRHTDEDWRAFKPEWKRLVEADTETN